MPFYRTNVGFMHIKFSGRGPHPKPCVAQIGIVAEGRPLQRCMALTGYLCDWPLSDGKTCDAPLCEAHAHQVGRNRHLCQIHFKQHQAEQPQPDLFGLQEISHE